MPVYSLLISPNFFIKILHRPTKCSATYYTASANDFKSQ